MDRLQARLAEEPELAAELYRCASEIVDDFDDYGPMIQADESGEYGMDSAIGRLRAVRDELKAKLEASVRQRK